VALKLWRLRPRPRPAAAPASEPGRDSEPEPEVRAGGGVVRRRGKNGQAQYALVHRPRYDDWSLPKGKADPGESDEEAALREVEEETGVRCTLGPELEPTRYLDRKGRLKHVRYWLMEPVEHGELPRFRPNHEIDELRWCSAADAGKLLSHEHDRKLIADAEALP
jgi:8-oxo-dGTP pyrophosphatase MutT (NUDIX family)